MDIKPGKYRHFKGNEYELLGTDVYMDSDTTSQEQNIVESSKLFYSNFAFPYIVNVDSYDIKVNTEEKTVGVNVVITNEGAQPVGVVKVSILDTQKRPYVGSGTGGRPSGGSGGVIRSIYGGNQTNTAVEYQDYIVSTAEYLVGEFEVNSRWI